MISKILDIYQFPEKEAWKSPHEKLSHIYFLQKIYTTQHPPHVANQDSFLFTLQNTEKLQDWRHDAVNCPIMQ